MMNESLKDIAYVTLIAGRKQKQELLEALSHGGGRIINVVYGRGSVKASYLMGVFGLVPEESKVVISCLMHGDKVNDMLDTLVEKHGFNEQNTGIAFTMPIEKLCF